MRHLCVVPNINIRSGIFRKTNDRERTAWLNDKWRNMLIILHKMRNTVSQYFPDPEVQNA